MKRAAVASAALLAVATLLTGCQKEEVEKLYNISLLHRL